MRIAFFCVRMQTGNGVDLAVHELAQRLVKDYGHSVDVWTPTSDGTYDNEAYKLRRLEITGDKRNRILVFHEINVYQTLKRLARSLNADGPAYDLVIPATHPYYGAGRAFGVPSVFFNCGNALTTGIRWISRLNYKWLDISENWLHKSRAAKVISISNFLHNKQSEAVRRRGTVLHLGGDHYGVRSDARRAEFREQLGLGPKHIVLGYCGRLFKNCPEYKGTHKVLELGHRLKVDNPNVRLVMCGAGDEHDQAWIRSQGAIPLCYLPVDDMPGFYDALDLYICASRWEGFNLPIVEAAWHWIPSVAYAAGAHGEHVTSVLVPDGDFDGLCNAASRLVNDDVERFRLAEAAWQKAQSFSWNTVAESFEQQLTEVLG